MQFNMKPVLSAILAAGLIAPAIADDAAVLRQMQEQMKQMQAQIEAMTKKLAEQAEGQKKVADTVAKNEKAEKARNAAAEVYGRLSLSVDNNSDDFGTEEGLGAKSNASRFGFRGVIPTTLGGDTSVIYTAEVLYGAADEDNSANDFKMREAFAGLRGNWGQTRAGRITVPYKAVYASIDPWTDHVSQARQGGRQGASALNANYFNNTLEYISPDMNGVKVSAWYSKQFDGETTGLMHNAGPLNEFNGGNAFGLGAKYEKGPWLASLDWVDVDADGIATTKPANGNAIPLHRQLSNDAATKLTGRYKAKNWSVAAHYEDSEDMGLGTNYYLNGIYTIDKLRLIAAYGVNKDANTFMAGVGQFNDAKTWSLGARYQIAKSTDLFAVYNSRKQDRDTNGTLAGVQDQFDTLSIGLVTNFSSK